MTIPPEPPPAPAQRTADADAAKAELLATQPGPIEPAKSVAAEEERRGRDRVANEERSRQTAVLSSPADEAEARSKRARLAAAARGAVGEKITPRVEKLRQASNVMLEEASYDPSVRFVLIAIFIVLLSLVLFFLNRVLG